MGIEEGIIMNSEHPLIMKRGILTGSTNPFDFDPLMLMIPLTSYLLIDEIPTISMEEFKFALLQLPEKKLLANA